MACPAAASRVADAITTPSFITDFSLEELAALMPVTLPGIECLKADDILDDSVVLQQFLESPLPEAATVTPGLIVELGLEEEDALMAARCFALDVDLPLEEFSQQLEAQTAVSTSSQKQQPTAVVSTGCSATAEGTSSRPTATSTPTTPTPRLVYNPYTSSPAEFTDNNVWSPCWLAEEPGNGLLSLTPYNTNDQITYTNEELELIHDNIELLKDEELRRISHGYVPPATGDAEVDQLSMLASKEKMILLVSLADSSVVSSGNSSSSNSSNLTPPAQLIMNSKVLLKDSWKCTVLCQQGADPGGVRCSWDQHRVPGGLDCELHTAEEAEAATASALLLLETPFQQQDSGFNEHSAACHLVESTDEGVCADSHVESSGRSRKRARHF